MTDAYFSIGDIVDISDRSHQHFGKRGRITRRIYSWHAYVIECEGTGEELKVDAGSLSFTKWSTR